MQSPSTKLPKTFVILAETASRNRGYVRYNSYVTDNGSIDYRIMLVTKMSDASKYVTLDNSKLKARMLKEKYRLKSVEVVDVKTKKSYIIR